MGDSTTYAAVCVASLPLQEVEYVMIFFLPEGLDDEGDALQTTGEESKQKGYEQQNAASTGIQDTTKAGAVANQSIQFTSSEPEKHFR